MLESLEILNGELTPKFDINNDTYSVSVGNEVTKLEINYQVKENSNVNIYGNDNLIVGENTVLIEVATNEEVNTYTLIVNREDVKKTTSLIDIEPKEVNVTKELPGYVAPLIAIICFVLILLTYAIVFHKKHK